MPKFFLPCPISGGCKTKITKHTFIKTCLGHQKNIGAKVGIGSARKRDHTDICLHCDIREDVANGLDFRPPEHIEFIPLPSMNELYANKDISPIKQAESTTPAPFEPLSTKEVKQICILLAKGIRQKDIASSYKVEPKLIRQIKKELL